MTLSDLFGFLDYPHTLEFNGGRIEPVPDYKEGLEYIMQFGNRDGYIYPPNDQISRARSVNDGACP